MKRPSVDPAFTFGVSLVVSLLLWLPTMRGALAGEIDITDAGIRYFLALAISWAGVFGIASLVAMYASQTPPPKPGKDSDHPMRRHDDDQPESPTEEDATAA